MIFSMVFDISTLNTTNRLKVLTLSLDFTTSTSKLSEHCSEETLTQGNGYIIAFPFC